MRHPARSTTTLTLLVALALPVGAQSPKPQEIPVYGVGVGVVAVPVFVTDKNGKAVPGLTAADFEIEDQGRKTEVVAFQAVDVTNAMPAAEAGTIVQAAARRQFLLLFDLMFSTPTGLMRAREAAIRFVSESFAPSDLAAAATFGQTGVQLLVGFTTDRVQLARAISGLGMVETQRLRDPLSLAYDLGVPREGSGIGSAASDRHQDQMLDYLRGIAQQQAKAEQAVYRQRVDGFLSGFEDLSRALGSVQGRKQVILLSSGFDSSVLGGAQGQEAQDASRAVTEGRLWDVQSERYFGDSAARDALDQLFRTLAASDTVVHSVDVTGLAAGGAVDEAAPSRIAQGRDTLGAVRVEQRRAADQGRERSLGRPRRGARREPLLLRCRFRAVRPGQEARSPAQAEGPREARRAGAVLPPRIRDPRPEARGPARRRPAAGGGGDHQGPLGRSDRAQGRGAAVPRREGSGLDSRGARGGRPRAARRWRLEAAAARDLRLRARRRGTDSRRLRPHARPRPGCRQAGASGQGAAGDQLLRGARRQSRPAFRGPRQGVRARRLAADDARRAGVRARRGGALAAARDGRPALAAGGARRVARPARARHPACGSAMRRSRPRPRRRCATAPRASCA